MNRPSEMSASTSIPQNDDTYKEVYAAPNSHYLGTINPEPKSIIPENYPELSPSTDPEVPVENEKQTGLPPNSFSHSPIPIESEYCPTAAPDVTEKELTPLVKVPWLKNWKYRILIIIAVILIIIGVVIGSVIGTLYGKDNSGSNNGELNSSTTPPTNTSSSPTPTSTTVEIDPPQPEDLKIGKSYNSTFTFYGTGDGTGGSNCSVPLNSCSFYTNPGYAVGVSQNLFGKGPHEGKGPACGTCWFLETFVDATGRTFKSNITAMVNEVCPASNDGGICAQKNLHGSLNSWGAQVNFNLCIDSGASDGLFGPDSDFGLAVGRATRVDCKDWEGKVQTY